MTQLVASHCTLESMEDNKINLMLNTDQAAMLNDRVKTRIADALSQYFDKKIKLSITVGENSTETPAEKQEKDSKAKQDEAVETLTSDPNVKNIMSTFGAKLNVDSIKTNDQ